MAVAREGEADDVPKELARYLSFQKLGGPALAAVAKALDDDGFRSLVLASTSSDDVDAAGWLFLTRPSGWEAALDVLAEGREWSAAEKRLKDLQRKLERSEAKREQAEAEVARRDTEAEAGDAELSALRRDKRQAEDDRQAAVRRVEELEQKLVDRDARVAEAQGAKEAREHELAETRQRLAEADAELARRPEPLVPGERAVDVAALREAAERLGRAAATLGRTVDAVLAEVPPEPVHLDVPTSGGRRLPLAVPGGVVADSAEGARWLLALPGVVLLVDGYNVAKTAWPDARLEEQRSRLIRALDGLTARTGAAAELVFDGPADALATGRQGTATVTVRYSGGELADDVVVDLVDAFPPERPVVVVSNDREVREAARAKAATVIGSTTLIGLLGT